MELLNPEPGGGATDELPQEIANVAIACADEVINIYETSTTVISAAGTLTMDILSQNIKRLAGPQYDPTVRMIMEARFKGRIHIDDVLDEGDAKLIDFINIVSVLFDVDIITEQDMKSRRESSRSPSTYVLREQQSTEPSGPSNS